VSASRSTQHFHELPLMLFTALGITGAGVAATHPVAFAFGFVPWVPARPEALLAALLTGSGLLISLLHLGRPARLTRALSQTGSNPLSNEVFAACLSLIMCLCIRFIPGGSGVVNLLWGIAASSALFFLISLGWVYRLPGQLFWTGLTVLSPALLGIVFGLLALSAYEQRANTKIVTAILGLLAVDAGMQIVRWIRLERRRCEGQPAHPRIFGDRHHILMVRFLSVTVLTPFAFLAAMPTIALIILGLGILHDRFAFYVLALQQTPESEIARLEELLHVQYRSIDAER